MFTPFQVQQINSDAYSDFLVVSLRLINEYICFEPRQNEAAKMYFDQGALKIFSLFMANQKEQIRMYGSPEEFEASVKKFGSFPLRHKMLGKPWQSVRQNIPRKYHNEKGELFYSKQEYLYHLQESTKIFPRNKALPADLEKFMKNHEERLGGCYEFVKFDIDAFEGIRKLFEHSKDLEEFNVEPGAEITYTIGPPRLVTFVASNYLENFKKVIKDYPHIFLPNKEHKSEKTTVAIRVFKDDGEEFMMESEVFNAVNLRNSDGKKKLKSKDRNGIINTISRHDFNRNFKIENVEYIPMPISCLPHAAVPIVTPTAEFCILASDALIEILRRPISGLKIFQKIKKDSWIMVQLWIKKLLESGFDAERNLYFMNYELLRKLKSETDQNWKSFDKTPAKAVREVTENGFTQEDLEKELKFLGLTTIFPEITRYAEKMYSELFKVGKDRVLRTNEMFISLEKCQLSCLFERFPMLMKFLHNQKACGRHPYKTCDECEESKKTVSEEKTGKEKEVAPDENKEKEPEKGADSDSIEVSSDENEKEKATSSETEEIKPEVDRKEVKKEESETEKSENAEEMTVEKIAEMLLAESGKKKTIIENLTEENRMLKAELAKKEEELILNKTVRETVEKLEQKNQKLKEAFTEKRMMIVVLTKQLDDQKEEMKLSVSKSNEEIKKLHERIKRKEAMEIQMKKENTEKMRKMNEEMERIQKKSETIQMEMTMKQSKMEEELREKDRVIKELQNSNRQRDMEKNQEMEKAMRSILGQSEKLSMQCEEQGKTIKKLLDRFYPSSEKECPICTDEMETSQETLKCEVCKKKIHLKCASEWHKKNRSCPICRSPQLNPEDYPSLG